MSNEREKILQSAQRHIDKRRFDKAIEEYQKIVQKDPNDARTLLKIGDLQARMQAYAEAIATYDRVGHYYAEQGFALKAIAVYKQIRELIRKHAPELADRYGHIVPKLADIYTQLGLTSDALAAYDEVATRLQRSGRDRDAIEIFRKMVVLDATNPLPHLRLAEACCRVQSLDEAIDSFWAAAELLLKLQRRDDALKVIERILHFRQDPRYARVAAELYLEKGNKEAGMQALQRLQTCFQADPKNLETLDLLAKAFTTIGQEAKSIEVYKEMARIAREQGRDDLYEKLVEHLQREAPDDEQVRALINLPRPAEQPAQSAPASAVSVDSEVELIDDAPEVAVEEMPFELQQQPARPPMMSGPEVVVDEAEDYTDAEAFDAEGHARKAVVDAESFRKLRLYSKAIETLRLALELDPGSIDIREKLREILSESGDRDGAIGEGVTLAAMLLDRGETEHAEMLLYDVLDMEPEHPAALEMLQQLQLDPGAYAAQAQAFEQAGYGRQGYDPHAPLPSYDLEEVGPSQALASGQPFGRQPRPAQVTQPDDPFAASNLDAPFGEEAPLPSFPLGAEDNDLMDGLDEAEAGYEQQSVENAPLPSFGQAESATEVYGSEQYADAEYIEPEYAEPEYAEPEYAEPEYAEPEYAEPEYVEPEYIEPEYVDDAATFDDQTTAQAHDTEVPAHGPEPSEAVEEVLEEADFFASRGLYDDAKAILTDQLSRTPRHPLVLERLRDVEEALASAGESRTIERSQIGATASEPVEEDHAFDIAASLDALDALDDIEVSAIQPEASSFANAEQEVDVDQVFAKFKEGVRAQVSESDSSTHYDLGVAYKEMGLLADAITEFELAARDPSRECMCFAMVGMIHLEQNKLDEAAEAYIRGLDAQTKTVEQEMSLYYDLGNVYEMKRKNEDALYYFKKIARKDPGFRDVKDRIAALEPEPAAPPAAARAVNDDDEFDRVFDDLFDTK